MICMMSYVYDVLHHRRYVILLLVVAPACERSGKGLGLIMNGRLSGKIAIITGATLGIGRTTAERFVAEGAKLLLVARRIELGEELVSFLMLKEAARAMRRSGKGGSIINVTSRTASVGVPTMTIYGASKGALLSLTRGAAIDLARYSIRGNAVAPGLTQTPLFEAWLAAQDDPEQFREATVATIPQPRFASPQDVASAILYFASDESSHVTGASLAVDGGYTAA